VKKRREIDRLLGVSNGSLSDKKEVNVENKTLLSLIEAASSKEEEKISDENGEFLFNEANRSSRQIENTTYGLIDPYINTVKEESNSGLQNDIDSSPIIPISISKTNVIYSILVL
jgi:hypothetical protein